MPSARRRLRIVRVVLALVLIVWFSTAAFARGTDYMHESWTEKDGLPGSYIGALAQDAHGYLWLIANGELVRFDGVRFVKWNDAEMRRNQPAIRPTSLYASADGDLWIGLFDQGMARLRDGVITLFDRDTAGHLLDLVRTIRADPFGTVWAGGQAGLARFTDGAWHHVTEAEGLPSAPVYGVHADSRGTVWVGSALGVYQRPRNSERFALALPSIRARGFAEDPTGEVWITGLDHPLRAQRDPSAEILPDTLLQSASGGWALLGDTRQNIWVATLGDGVWRVAGFGQGTPKVERFDGRLSSSVVRSLLEDREGNIWVGTDNGLNRLTVSAVPSQPSRLRAVAPPVVAMTTDRKGDIWIGTQNGLFRVNAAGGNAAGVQSESIERFDRRHGLSGTAIYALHAAPDGALWISGDLMGLVRRGTDGTFTTMPMPPKPTLRVTALTSDRAGALYLCDTDWGVMRWQDGTLTDVLGDVPSKSAFSALTDRDGRVWFGLTSRVLVLNPDGSRLWLGSEQGLGEGRVTTLFQDSHGVVWAGSDAGLSRYHDGRFTSLTVRHHDRPQYITAVLEDLDANLWIGTMSGVARLTPGELDAALAQPAKPLALTVFDIADGLNGAPIWLGFPTATRGRDGALWFVTSNGLATFQPREMTKTRLPPPVLVESVTGDDRRAPATGTVSFPSSVHRVQVDYTALSFTVPEKLEFRYMLEGFDADWVVAGTRRQAFYTNLPPRRYRFRVLAGNDGAWNEVGAARELVITPAVYQTAWFRVAAVLGLALVGFAFVRLQLRREREKFDLVLAERARMGREIHDTLLQSLVGVSLQFEAVRSRMRDLPAALRNEVDLLRKRVDHSITEARQSILDLRSGFDGARDLADAIRRSVRRQTQGTRVKGQFEMKGPPHPCGTRVDQQLLRIAQEAVANAIRHAQATVIRVELTYADESVTLRVTDNGQGFDMARPAFTPEDHWGLANMQERADQIGADFRVVSAPGQGTEIEAIAHVPVVPQARAS